jgi:hypothetical protein
MDPPSIKLTLDPMPGDVRNVVMRRRRRPRVALWTALGFALGCLATVASLWAAAANGQFPVVTDMLSGYLGVPAHQLAPRGWVEVPDRLEPPEPAAPPGGATGTAPVVTATPPPSPPPPPPPPPPASNVTDAGIAADSGQIADAGRPAAEPEPRRPPPRRSRGASRTPRSSRRGALDLDL